MLRNGNVFTRIGNLGTWLLVAILAAVAILTFANLASAQQSPILSAPVLTAQAEESKIELSWTAVTDAARYELWTWTSTDGWQQLDDSSLTGTTYTHTEVTAGTTYHYTIRAVNADDQTSAMVGVCLCDRIRLVGLRAGPDRAARRRRSGPELDRRIGCGALRTLGCGTASTSGGRLAVTA